MATELTTLIVEADIQVGRYIEHANQKAAADAAMVAGASALNTSITETDRRLSTTSGFNSFLARNDQTLKATQQFEAALRRLNSVFSAGDIGPSDYSRQLGLLNDRFAVNVTTAARAEEANRKLADSYRETARAAQAAGGILNSFGEQLDQIRAKYNPLFAAQLAFENSVKGIDAALSRMAVTQDEHAAAIDREIAAYDRAVGATNQYAAATARAAEQAAAAQVKVNQTLGVRDDFGTAARQKDIESYGASLDNLRTKYVPLAAAEERRKQALAEINTGLAIFDLSQQEATAAIERTNVAYAKEVIEINRASVATSNSSRLLGLNRLGMLELQAAGVNAFQALASGQDLWRVAQTESAQVLGAFIQGGDRALTFLKTWGPALAAAAIPLAAFGSAVALVFERSSNLRAFNVELSTIARGSSATAEGLQEVVEHLERIGVSADDARAALANMLRQVPQGLNVTDRLGGSADQLTVLAKNISTARGTDFLQESRELTTAVLGNVDALNKYGMQVGVITGLEAAANVERARAGELGTVQTEVVQKLTTAYQGAAEKALGPVEKAIRDITNAWREWAKVLAEGGVGDFITSEMHKIAEGIKGTLGEIQAIVEFVKRLRDSLPGGTARQSMSDYIGGEVQGPSVPARPGYTPAEAAKAGGLGGLSGDISAMPVTNEELRAALGPNATAPFNRITPSGTITSLRPERPPPSDLGPPPSYAGFLDPRDVPTILPGVTTGSSPEAIAKQAEKINRDRQELDIAREFPAVAARKRAAMEAEDRARQTGLVAQDAKNAKTAAEAQADRLLQAEVGKTATLMNMQAEASARITAEFNKSIPAGLRQIEVEKAKADVLNTGADAQQVATQRLQANAEAAIQASAQQEQVLNRTLADQKALADASALGTAQLKERQIQQDAVTRTLDAQNLAEAAYNQALEHGTDAQKTRTAADLEAAKAAQQVTAAKLRQIEAERETTGLNQRTEQLRNDAELVKLTADLQGKSTEEIQKQGLELRAQQQIKGQSATADQTAKDNYIAATKNLADQNVRLAENQRITERINEEWRSIADTISSAIGDALDKVLSGQKIESWGAIFKGVIHDIAREILQTEFVKPLIGSIIGGDVARQYGTLGGGGGIFSQLLGAVVSAGGAGGSGGTTNLTNFQGTGLSAQDVAAVSSNVTQAIEASRAVDAGGSGGIGNILNIGSSLSNIADSLGSGGAGGTGFFGLGSLNEIGSSVFGLANPALQGPTITGAPLGSVGTLGGASLGSIVGGVGGGFTVGTMLNSLLGGKQTGGMIGSGTGAIAGTLIGGLAFGPVGALVGGLIGGGAGGGLGGLVGPSPSRQASGNVLNLGTGGVGDPRSSGNAQNDATVQQISGTLSQFLGQIRQLTGGTIEGALNIVSTTKGIQTSYTGPLGNIQGRFASAQEAISGLENAILHNLTGVSDTMRTVLAHVSDPSQLQAAVAAAQAYDAAGTAFDALFTSIEEATNQAGPYSQILTQINAQYDALTQSAQQYGLSIAPIAEAYAKAQQRLIDDFNKNVRDVLSSMTDPFHVAIEAERKQGEQRLADATKIGADIAQVEKLNQANMLRIALNTADQLTTVTREVDDFVGTLGDSFERLFSSIEIQMTHLFTSTAGVQQLSGGDQFSQAFNSIQAQAAAASTAARATFSNSGVLDAVLSAISGVAQAAINRLAVDFNAGIDDLATAATDPLQEAITKEVIAGNQRVAVAQAVGADVDKVLKFNEDNLLRVAAAAQQAVNGIASVAQILNGAGSALSGAVSSVVQVTSGPFAQALDNLNATFGALINQVDALSGATADVTPILQAYAAQIDNLRNTFNAAISQLILGITDPVQAALNTELEAGRARVAEASRIGADLAAVDRYNSINLVRVFESATSAVQTAAQETAETFNASIAQLTLGITDPVQAALNVEIEAGKQRVAQALALGADIEAVVKYNNLNLIHVYEGTQTAAGGAADALRDLINSLSTLDNALSQLSRGPLSGLTPRQESQSTLTEYRRLLGLVQGGDASQIPALAQAGTAAVQAAQSAYGNAQQTARIRDEVTRSLGIVRDETNKQVNIEQDKTATAATAARAEDQSNKLQASIRAQQEDLQKQITAFQAQQAVAQANKAALEQQSYREQVAAYRAQAEKLLELAAQLDARAVVEFQRTGVANNIYQQEADAARQGAAQISAQLAGSAAVTAAEVDRAKLTVGQVQQQADIGNRTLAAQSDTASSAGSVALASRSGYDLAIEQLAIQRKIAADAQAIARQSIDAQVAIANQVIAAQKAAADAFTAAVNAYAAAVAQAQAVAPTAATPPAPPPVVIAPQRTPEEIQYAASNYLQDLQAGRRPYANVTVDTDPANQYDPITVATKYAQDPRAGIATYGYPHFFAAGTTNAPPGWALVGEGGPELMRMRGGEQILPSGARPPANDDFVAELRRLREEVAMLRKQTQGGQIQASRDARQIADVTTTVSNKIDLALTPTRRNVA